VSGQQYDAPNQQVVREDSSGPGMDAPKDTAGDEPRPAEGEQPDPEQGQQAAVGGVSDLDLMTKADLLEYAKELGVSPANNDMTKDELRAGIEAQG
jgi:hypothetical protein